MYVTHHQESNDIGSKGAIELGKAKWKNLDTLHLCGCNMIQSAIESAILAVKGYPAITGANLATSISVHVV